MLRFYFDKRILIGFLLALAILSWLATSSYLITKALMRSNNVVARSLDIFYNTQRILAGATSIELSQRGFSLTGKKEFLDTYNSAAGEIILHVQNLQALTQNNMDGQQRMETLKKNIDELLRLSSASIEARENPEATPREIVLPESKAITAHIRAAVTDIERTENILLKAQHDAEEKELRKFNYTFIALLLATGAILVVIFFTVNVNLKARIGTEARLSAALGEIKDLYDNAPCGYHSLDQDGLFVNVNNTLLKWLGYSKEEVLGKKKFTDVIPARDMHWFLQSFEHFKRTGHAYNVEFNFLRKDGKEFPVMLNAIAIVDEKNQYIKSRSITFDNTERRQAEAKIRNLNQELEAFTYSVSHDLRAPLRSIDGYSKILQEDYFDKLDNEGRRVISVIMGNARRMGKLIDDLLDFARLGRTELMSRTGINMEQLVSSVLQEQLEQERGRKIDINVESLIAVQGDPDMMRQVWENLLSNAIKYTGKVPHARIEVSSSWFGNEICYRVADNGVGFDMKYAHKLFGVFQRLHKVQDFTGTGVGLAIVKRIIDRHKGRVWAESKVNEGATFYFTIPNDNGKQ